jgi:hypothetical protein
VSDRAVLVEAITPDGRPVVIYHDTWLDHIIATGGHPELAPHLEAVLSTITAPDHREDDPREGRERFYKQDVGPSQWLMVVVSFAQEPARVITALG